MTDTLATIGFKADTSDLVKADKALSNLETTAASTEKQLKVAESGMKSMGAASAAQASQVQKFVQVLQDEAATIGMSSKELALYKANQLGATQADKQAIVAAIDKIEAYERSAAAAKANAAATAQMGGAYGGARGAMQSFGYQLQDTIVQAQMGANAFMILSQQGSQMASAFGPTGAIVGALIAVAGVAGMVLAPSLMDSKTNAEKLATAMDALGQAAERNEDGVLQLTNEIKELAKQSDLAVKAQLQAVMIKSAEAMTLASKAAADMVDSLTGAGYGLYDVSDAMSELGKVVKLNSGYMYIGTGTGKAFYETVQEIGVKFGQTGKAAEQLGIDVLKAIKAMGEAKSPEGINKAREYLLQTAQAAKMSDKELADFIVTINKLATDGITAADTAKLLADSLSDGGVGAASAKDKLKELTQQAMLAKEEFINGEAAAQKLALAFELGFDSAKQLTPELSAQVDELIRWQEAGKEVEEQIRRIAKAEQDMEDAFGGEDMLTEVYQNRAKAAEKLMDEWSEGVDEFQSQGQAIDSLVASVKNLGGAWSSSGSAMIDAFGSAADIIDDYMKRVGEVSDLEVKLKAVRDDSSSSAIDKSKAEVALLDLQYQGQRANLSMLSKTAGAAASMFKEQSKERKALHMAEKAFAAVEIALAMQKAGASAVAAIANQGTGDPYTAFARIAAMMGIMAGLGVFSGGGGGGGYSAPTSGTGTVTGDGEAKSGSIGNASDEFKDIALDQLFELQGIRESMNQLAGGIANLAVSLIRSSSFGGGNAVGIGKSQAVSAPSFMQEFGDKFSAIDPLIGVFDGVLNKVLAGVFGTTKKTLIDAGLKFDSQSIADILSNGFNGYYYNVIETTKKKMFGLSKKTSTGTELQDVESGVLNEIGSIFGFLADSISAAIDVLGVDTANAIDTFVVNLGSVSFKDMTGDEIQKELEAMFSQQGDLMAEYVFPHIKQYQQMGEGALETLMRVSKEQAMFDDGLNKIGQSLSSASRIMQIDVAQAIATMMGGMDEFASKTNQYFKAFFSESEQFDYLAKSLAEAMSGIGLPMVSSREGFRSIVDGLDLTTESGQKMFAELMKLVPGMDQYLSALEAQRQASEEAAEAARKEAEAKAAALKAQGLDLQLRLYDALGQSAEALALRRQMELDATDETLRALLLQIYAAEDAAAAQRELASAQEAAAKLAQQRQSLEIQLLEATGQSAQALAMQRQIELEAMDESLRGLQLNVWSALDAAAAQKELAEAQAESAAKAEQLLEQRQSMEIELLNATGKAAEATAMQRAIELSAMDESLRALQQQIWAANDATEAQMALAEAQKAAAESARDAVQSAFGKLQDSASAEKEILQSALDARLSAIDSERQAIENQRDSAIDGFQKSSQAIDDYVGKLQEINDTITGFIAESSGAVNPFKRLGEIFNEFKGGITPDNSELGSVLGSIRSAGSAGFESATDQARAMAIAMNQAQGIGALASNRASSARSQYDVISESAAKASAYYAEELSKLDAEAELAKAQHAEQVSAIDSQLAEAQKQLNVLLGIDDRILSMADALAEFYAAINNASILQQSSTEKALDSAITSASLSQVEAIYQSAAESSMTQVEAIYESVAVQVEAINNVAIAIEQLGEQIIEINKPEDRVWVPPTMPVSFTNEGEPVTREMVDLLKELTKISKANNENSSKSASLLQEMTIGGLDVRVEA